MLNFVAVFWVVGCVSRPDVFRELQIAVPTLFFKYLPVADVLSTC